MIIFASQKEKQITKARSQDLRACDGEVEGDLKTSGTGGQGEHVIIVWGVITPVRLGVTRVWWHCKHLRV